MAEAESLGGNEPFTGELLEQLGQLVHADWVSTTSSIACAGEIFCTSPAGDEDDLGDEDPGPVFWDYVIEAHPVCLRHQQGHHGRA